MAYAIRENPMMQRSMKKNLGGRGCINPVVGGLGRGQGLYVKFLHFLIQKVTKFFLDYTPYAILPMAYRVSVKKESVSVKKESVSVKKESV